MNNFRLLYLILVVLPFRSQSASLSTELSILKRATTAVKTSIIPAAMASELVKYRGTTPIRSVSHVSSDMELFLKAAKETKGEKIETKEAFERISSFAKKNCLNDVKTADPILALIGQRFIDTIRIALRIESHLKEDDLGKVDLKDSSIDRAIYDIYLQWLSRLEVVTKSKAEKITPKIHLAFSTINNIKDAYEWWRDYEPKVETGSLREVHLS